MRLYHKIGIGIIISISTMMYFGINNPPKRLLGSELSQIDKVSTGNGQIYYLKNEDIELWDSTEFNISTENYPGETPDYVIYLIGKTHEFTAMYNKDSEIIFFSFIPEIKYGLLNTPAPQGWNKPIYETKVSDKLLKMLRMNQHPL